MTNAGKQILARKLLDEILCELRAELWISLRTEIWHEVRNGLSNELIMLSDELKNGLWYALWNHHND